MRGLALVEPPFGLDLTADLGVDDIAAAGRALSRRRVADLRDLVDGTSILADVAAEPPLTDAEVAALPGDLLVVFGDRSPCRVGVDDVRRSRPDATIALLPGDHEVHTQAVAELSDLLASHLARWSAPLQEVRDVSERSERTRGHGRLFDGEAGAPHRCTGVAEPATSAPDAEVHR